MVRENRYLLFLTENYAALEILKQYLQDQERTFPQFPSQSDESTPQSTGGSDELSRKPWEMEPFVLFGSSFPKDKEYTQVIVSEVEELCIQIHINKLHALSTYVLSLVFFDHTQERRTNSHLPRIHTSNFVFYVIVRVCV